MNMRHEDNYSKFVDALSKDFPALAKCFLDGSEHFAYIEVGEGWYPLIYEMMRLMNQRLDKQNEIIFLQIKEKFGALRVYHSADGIHRLVSDLAERRSSRVCEICGEIGQPFSPKGWVKTLCEHHQNTPPNNLFIAFEDVYQICKTFRFEVSDMAHVLTVNKDSSGFYYPSLKVPSIAGNKLIESVDILLSSKYNTVSYQKERFESIEELLIWAREHLRFTEIMYS